MYKPPGSIRRFSRNVQGAQSLSLPVLPNQKLMYVHFGKAAFHENDGSCPRLHSLLPDETICVGMTKRIFPFYQVKRVFLACPGDLVSERSKFPKLIETVNNMRAHSLGFHLEAVGWERVIPSFGRPQELINRELELADLVVVLFWNRIGSPASRESAKTGTVEEFDMARRLHVQVEKPLVWVYFRKPTAEEGEQLNAVLAFRKSIEEERDLFFREYESVEDFEEMFRQHLVAYLDGLRRWDIDENVRWMRPEHALMNGDFLAEGVYTYGTTMRLRVDLDGDGRPEEVEFEYRHGGFSLYVRRFDKTIGLALPEMLANLRDERLPKTIHLAIKDVTNDGLPEVLLAVHDGMIELTVAVYGFNSNDARANRVLDADHFSLLQLLEGGQRIALVLQGGSIVMPYGTVGLAWTCKWNGERFDRAEQFGVF